MDVFYAHSIDGCDKSEWQALEAHLSNVSVLSSSFAEGIGLGQLALATGLLHDLGKACPEFQARLSGASNRVDHSSAGAIVANEELGDIGLPIAYAVAGHHSGMSNGTLGEPHLISLQSKMEKKELLNAVDNNILRGAQNQLRQKKDKFAKELLVFIRRGSSGPEVGLKESLFQLFLLTRFLFSSLVDADYLDTERFMVPQMAGMRLSPGDSIDQLIAKYNRYMKRLCENSPDNELNACRRLVREQCLHAANLPQGFFTLYVPTGGGKTLSVVGFALRHAKQHGLKRIIIALPYTNLIEQTADIMRDVFGAQNVLEHHSNYDFDALDTDRAQHEKLAAQNWDVPIVVTTNVQLFESLFSNRPGKSRKVHNIANSVLILDEAQSLPDEVLTPTLAMLEMLVRSCRVTCVLCTATQPYFKDIWPFEEEPQEIVTDRTGFNKAFDQRTHFENLGTLRIDQLCDRLVQEERVLCIVGNKSEAREIYRSVVLRLDKRVAEESCFCLSTNKTPYHRSLELRKIKRLLDEGKPCYVVSTQLIEAGVDIDFPVVYRELSGIDSLFQAAGRCNREGTIEPSAPVYVFECEKDDGTMFGTTPWLAKQRDITRSVLRERDGIIDSDAIESFFKMRYSNSQELDAHGVLSLICRNSDLESALKAMPFATVADRYRLIEDEAFPVFVRWGDEAEKLYQRMLRTAQPGVLSRSAQRYSLALRGHELKALEQAGYIEELPPFKILNACDGCRVVYDDKVGYRFGEEELLTLIG